MQNNNNIFETKQNLYTNLKVLHLNLIKACILHTKGELNVISQKELLDKSVEKDLFGMNFPDPTELDHSINNLNVDLFVNNLRVKYRKKMCCQSLDFMIYPFTRTNDVLYAPVRYNTETKDALIAFFEH
jgi:hypothetical protein